MPVEVRPETFSMVLFDAAEIRAIADKLVSEIGLPADLPVTVDVDETTPMGRAVVTGLAPVVLSLESGALEDPKRPRQLDAEGAADVIGRLLYEGIFQRDFPLVQGIVILAGIMIVLINLIIDISYTLFDPRIRY